MRHKTQQRVSSQCFAQMVAPDLMLCDHTGFQGSFPEPQPRKNDPHKHMVGIKTHLD